LFYFIQGANLLYYRNKDENQQIEQLQIISKLIGCRKSANQFAAKKPANQSAAIAAKAENLTRPDICGQRIADGYCT
jgi:hypothetical protein